MPVHGEQPPGEQLPAAGPPAEQTPREQPPGAQPPGTQPPGTQPPGEQLPAAKPPAEQTPREQPAGEQLRREQLPREQLPAAGPPAGDECSICLTVEANFAIDSCIHVFCRACITRWQASDELPARCPLCRKFFFRCLCSDFSLKIPFFSRKAFVGWLKQATGLACVLLSCTAILMFHVLNFLAFRSCLISYWSSLCPLLYGQF